ncbi:MAG: GNAT family N-acetyltransferase [Candidatus Limnocylindrales bacterium]
MRPVPVIRAPTPIDAAAAATLQARNWAVTYASAFASAAVGRAIAADRRAHWERLLTGGPPDRGALVAELGGRIIGLVEWQIGPDGDPTVGEVHALHVDPDAHRQGVGRALLAAAAASLRDRGARRAFLWVLADNSSARAFYEHQGWPWDGTCVDRPLGGYPDLPSVTECRHARHLDGAISPGT